MELAERLPTFTVVLNTQPTADVTIGLSSNDTTEGTVGPSSITFTPANWNTPQTITITGVNDNVDDGDITYSVVTAAATSSDTTYNGLNAADVAVTTFDDDAAGITVSPTSGLTTTEAGGTASFTIVLNSQPTANVTIGLSSSNTAEGTASSGSITFTPANWNTAQTITVTGVNDFVDDGDIAYSIVTAAAASADSNYSGLDAANVAAINIDNDTVGVTVTPTTGLSTSEGGGAATFTIVLNTQPSADVTIGLSSSDTAEGTVSASSVTFTAANWNTPQTVTVTGVNDNVDDGDIAYTIVTAAATSADGNYSGLDAADVDVTNVDNDAAAIIVTPTSGLVTTEGGGTASFTIVLATQPTANVTIGLTSSDTSEGTASTGSVTFTPANWNTPQTITVTGADDVLNDGPIGYSIVTATATSADSNYSSLNAADVSVTNNDDDTPGITVTPTSGLITTEAGGQATFTIVLDSQPTADVTIALSSSNTAEGDVSVTSVTFTTADWNTPQTITIVGANDSIDDGNINYTIVTAATVSADASYNGVAVADVAVSNTDDDTAGITVSPTSGLVTTEAGGTASFTIVLDTQPTANVTIGLSSSNTAEGTVSVSSVTFTAANWNTPQTINVTGVNDFVDDGNISYTIVTSAATSSDSNYNGINAADVSASNTDNDTVGITISPTSGLTTTEAGGTATFTIVLNSQPTANVAIGLSSSNTAEGTVSVSSVTFTAANWNTPQTITVTGVNDFVDDGNIAYSIVTGAATSSDSLYNGLNASDVSVSNTDNDAAGFTVIPTSGMTTTEAGVGATFTVVLTSQPTANVTIGVASSDTTEGTVSTGSLTFTPANWNTPQSVIVTGVNDFLDDGNIGYTIVLAAATSADANYNGVNPVDPAVTNTDNDATGVTITPLSGLSTTEAGGTAIFTLVLTSQPTANVTIGLASSNMAEGNISAGSVVFTPANWNTPQTITITGIDDFYDDGDASYSIITSAAVSSDVTYSGFNAADVAVTNIDNDTAGISVSLISGATSETGGTATFTIVLTSLPAANVVIGLSSGNAGEGTVSTSSVTFTPANWNVPQTVTVTGVNDFVDDGDVNYSITTAPAVSAAVRYNGMNASDVTVTNIDNDTAGITVTPISTTTTEAGGTASFSIVLDSMPVANVVIGLSSSNPGEGVPSASSVTFTPTNWNVPQIVTVSGVNDFVDDGNRSYSLITAPAVSAAVRFNGMNAADVALTNIDNDTAGIVVTSTSGLSTSELGGTATFTIVLTSQPTANVTIGLASSDTSEGTLSASSVTFTPANWSSPQTITVTGVNDSLNDGDIGYSILTAAATSADSTYNGMNGADLGLTNLAGPAGGFATLGPDPTFPSANSLQVIGTSLDDVFDLTLANLNRHVRIVFNGTVIGEYALAGLKRIIVSGGDGNDRLIARNITIPVKLDGGDGNDYLVGGTSNDLILGGLGDDFVSGGLRGRDFLIGGRGKDRINAVDQGVPAGTDHNDILVGGTTAYDNNDAALNAILAQWTSTKTLATRVHNVKTGVGCPALSPSFVFDDLAVDQLAANLATDLLFKGIADQPLSAVLQ